MFFTRRSFTTALFHSGFELLDMRHETLNIPLDYVHERLCKTPGLNLPFIRGSGCIVPANLIDVFLFEAVRR